ncbi:MAG: PAC2 family protein [Chloroflexota bacterium]|nr:PAC2 family protein [Chloroflexota bacterium]
MEYVNIDRHPRLKKPVLLAAWPGVSNVALEVADYLREKLDAKEFANIDPVDFFTPVGILVHKNVVEVPVFPENKFYYVKIPKAKHDLIVFCGESQPDQNQYELAQIILDAAQKLKVQRIYTCAAALVPHSVQKSRVLVAATDAKLIKELQKYDVMATGDFQIRGLNGLLLGAAKEREMDGICILGETPQFAAEMPNPMACYAVLKVMTEILGVDIDLSDIAKEAVQMAETMKALSQEMMVKYIDHFTQPIWERNPSEEEN